MTICATSLWLLIIVLPSFLLLIYQKKQKREQKYNLPPGPNNLPLIGNLYQLGSNPHRSLWKLSQKHGPLMHLNLGLRPTLILSSAEMAKEVLKTHDLNFCTRPRLICTDKYSYNCSDIGFAPYGECWRELRKICILELFSVKRVETFKAVREEEVSLMVQSMQSSSSKPINMRNAMISLTNGIICRIALGRQYPGVLHEILEEVQALLGSFFFADYFPMLGWIDKLTGQDARLEKSVRELDDFYENVIKVHLDEERMIPEHEDIVDVLLRLQKDEGHLTMENIKGVLTVSTAYIFSRLLFH